VSLEGPEARPPGDVGLVAPVQEFVGRKRPGSGGFDCWCFQASLAGAAEDPAFQVIAGRDDPPSCGTSQRGNHKVVVPDQIQIAAPRRTDCRQSPRLAMTAVEGLSTSPGRWSTT
jgi:hypothetical protein